MATKYWLTTVSMQYMYNITAMFLAKPFIGLELESDQMIIYIIRKNTKVFLEGLVSKAE